MIHDPQTAANEFINRGIREGKPLTHIEAQTILYLSRGWMLGIHGRPFHNGAWAAWRYSLVLSEVYFNLNNHRGKSITTPIKGAPSEPFAEEEKAVMEVVYGYRTLGTYTLAGISQSQKGPWRQAWHGKYDGAIIRNDIMQSYFAGLLQQYETQND